MEVNNNFPAVWLMVIGCGLFMVATSGFIQVVLAMNFAFWFVVAAVWTLVICIRAITSTDEPEGKALA